MASDDSRQGARERLAALADSSAIDETPAHRLERDILLLKRLLTAAGHHQRNGGQAPDVAQNDVGAALSLFEDMRHGLDQLETRVVMEARRRGMDWRQIAHYQGFNSSQAASQRYQRLMTRLEEIRQGVR